MIIPAKRTLVQNGVLQLHREHVAALSLTHGSPCYVAIEAPTADAHVLDVVVTSINPDFWADTWRIEVETYDKPGNLLVITDLLAKLDIEVICAEGATNDFGTRHAMTFVVCCRKHSQNSDGSIWSRPDAKDARLPLVETLIRANLAQEITFNNSKHPRVKVKRIEELVRLSKGRSAGQVLVERCSVDNKRRIKLSADAWKGIRNRLSDPVGCSLAIDTKSRLVRAMIFRSDLAAPGHVQVTTNMLRASEVADVYRALYRAGANVTRFQMRPSSTLSSRNSAQHGEGLSRWDITFHSTLADVPAGRIIAHLAEKFPPGQEGTPRVSDSYSHPEALSEGPGPEIETTSDAPHASIGTDVRGHLETALRQISDRDAEEVRHKRRDQRHELYWRRRLIEQTRQDIDGTLGPRLSVFISYSKRATDEMQRAQQIAVELGFEIRTGFQDDVEFGLNMTRDIIDSINRSKGFLGIWTPEFRSQVIVGKSESGADLFGDEGGGISPWMHFELGAAMHAKLPFKVLSHHKVLPSVRSRTTPSEVSVTYNSPADFDDKARKALAMLKNRILDRERFPGFA